MTWPHSANGQTLEGVGSSKPGRFAANSVVSVISRNAEGELVIQAMLGFGAAILQGGL